MKLFFENKKLRGWGYSVLRKQNMGRFISFLFAIALAKSQSIFLQRGAPMRQHIKRELALPQLWRSRAK
ncbi:MAG: hypothetical protein IKB77_03110, partial [Lentisphaeria bacterium]|nr:hypothetical protein [Lentisphaeria bacterium]